MRRVIISEQDDNDIGYVELVRRNRLSELDRWHREMNGVSNVRDFGTDLVSQRRILMVWKRGCGDEEYVWVRVKLPTYSEGSCRWWLISTWVTIGAE
jgi:hypothetical protein